MLIHRTPLVRVCFDLRRGAKFHVLIDFAFSLNKLIEILVRYSSPRLKDANELICGFERLRNTEKLLDLLEKLCATRSGFVENLFSFR